MLTLLGEKSYQIVTILNRRGDVSRDPQSEMLTFDFISQERKEINIKDAAKLYHEKEQEIKRKEQGSSDNMIYKSTFTILPSNRKH